MTITRTNGNVEYFDDSGRLHRDDGPAIISADGSYAWFKHGVTHRAKGLPAVFVTLDDGIEVTEYWSNGVLVDAEYRPARDQV